MKMHSHMLSFVLVSILLGTQASVAQAAIVSTNQLTAQTQTQADRAKVQAFFERADVKQRLQALGVKSVFAQERVAALDDHEVHALAQKIDSLPAGGDLKNLSDSDIMVLLLAAILLVLIV